MLSSLSSIQTHFAKYDPTLAKAFSTLDLSDWLTPSHPTDYFQNLTQDIVSQQLSGKAADTIYTRFQVLVGEVTPRAVLSLEDQSLRDVGLSWAKVKYVKDLAEQTQRGTVNLASLDSLSDDKVVEELIKVKGIGQWTAEMFLIFTLHREDVFSYGDLGLRKGLAKLYNLVDPTDEQIGKIISPWSPYKSYGSLALWHYLDNR